MSKVWAGMITIGIGFSVFNGKIGEINNIIMESSENAVVFILGLSGIMAVWSGFLKIAEKSGLINLMAEKLEPLVANIFPYEHNKETISIMCMSMAANIFGVGNTATVFGIKAMKRLDIENNYSNSANETMCMFLAITMSSIQLIPVTVIKIRSESGAVCPEDIILPTLLATFVSTFTAIIICKIFEALKK